MSTMHEKGYFNGAIVVGTESGIVYESGFGLANISDDVPFTPDTPTWCASIAKNLTAAAVIMLEGEGEVNLDRPAAEYLPGFPYPDVTVRHMLAHSSGLLPTAVYFLGVDPEGATRTNRMLLDLIIERRPPLSFEPGTGFQYSNAAYDLLALLIELVSGDSYIDFLEERILGPLGMNSTFLRPAWNRDWSRGPRIHAYEMTDGDLQVIPSPDNDANYGSDGLYSSVRDLYKWASSFYTKPVLNETNLASGLQAPLLGDQPSALNLMCWYYSDSGEQSYFTGSGQGYYTFVYWDADSRTSVVWASNQFSPVPPPMLTLALLDILGGRTPAPVEPPQYAPLNVASATAWPTIEELATLCGEWKLGSGNRLTIGMREGIDDLRQGWPLYAQVDDGVDYHIFPDGDILYVPGLDAFAWFADGDDGRVIHWSRVFGGTHVGTGP